MAGLRIHQAQSSRFRAVSRLCKFVGPACPSRPIQRAPLGKWGFELMLFGNSGAACPEGTYENSPAFQRRDSRRTPPSPEGTAELPRPFASIQPSRLDSNALDHLHGVETPGYCRMSLRDNAAART